MSVAGDKDYEGPVVWVHEDTSCLSAGGVERRGAAPVGALHTAACHLPLHPFPAVRTLLPEWRENRVQVTTLEWHVEVKEVKGGERKQGKLRGRQRKIIKKKKKVVKRLKRQRRTGKQIC